MKDKGSEKKVEEIVEKKQDFEALAQAARIERGRQAKVEIDAVCAKYKVTILPMLTIIGTQIQSGIQVVPQ